MPLLWLSLAFLGGILLGAEAGLPAWSWLALAAALPLLVSLVGRLPVARRALARGRRPPLPVPVILAFLLLGAARYQAAQPRLAPDFIAWYNDTRLEMAVVGVVAAPPDQRDTYTNLRIAVERVRPGGSLYHTAVRGLLLVRVPAGGSWRYGDRLVLRGELETPPEDEAFSYREYLARQGVYAYMPKGVAARLASGQGNPALAALFALKARALEVVYQIFPDPEAALLAGILLGVETGIPELGPGGI